MNSNFTEITLRNIEPIIERALSLEASAQFKIKASELLMQQGRETGSANATLNLTAQAQVKLNEADAYRNESRELLTKVRAIVRAEGKSLPGMDDLRVIADRFTQHISANA